MGVNEHGVTVAIANLYPASPSRPPAHPVSRGLLVLEALECGSSAEARLRIESADLVQYQPFHLVCAEAGDVPRGTLWDGRTLIHVKHRGTGLIATSSSRDQPGAAQIRSALFERAAQLAGGLTDSALDELHRSREPEPGPYAISMERSDAATVSMSVIRVSSTEVSFEYTPGPPHRTKPLKPLSLERWVPTSPGARSGPHSDLP